MSGKPSLTERLASGRPLLLDGAMNTELSRRGLRFNTVDWLRVNLDAPQAIADTHAAYARAGAELHIANSFAAARHVLEPAGLGKDFAAINRAAVEICRTAIEGAAAHPQWIAGSISTYAPDHDRNNLPGPVELERNARDQAALLAAAGCHMIALEMLFDVEASLAMLKGAQSCGLPVSLGLVCARDDRGNPVLEGTRDIRRGKPNIPLDDALRRLLDGCPDGPKLILAVMHSELEDTAPALEQVRRVWSGDIAVYPNNGRYAEPGGWDTSDGCTPEGFARACEAWRRQGANILGGCCGIGPAHIQALGQKLR